MMIWEWKDSSVGRVFDQHTGNPGWGQFPGLPKKGHAVHICNPRIQEMKTGRPEIILDYSEQGLAQDECLSENTYSIKRNMKQAILQKVSTTGSQDFKSNLPASPFVLFQTFGSLEQGVLAPFVIAKK